MEDFSDDRSKAPEASAGERLDSWKEIAAYLRRDIRTVQRWERKGFPVHRLLHQQKATVYAYRSEIDDWLESQPSGLEKNGLRPAWLPSGKTRRRWVASGSGQDCFC